MKLNADLYRSLSGDVTLTRIEVHFGLKHIFDINFYVKQSIIHNFTGIRQFTVVKTQCCNVCELNFIC